MTLVELLVATIMGVIVVGGRDGDADQRRARPAEAAASRRESVDTARCELERMTREIRNGVERRRRDGLVEQRLLRRQRAAHQPAAATVPTSPSAPGDPMPDRLHLHDELLHAHRAGSRRDQRRRHRRRSSPGSTSAEVFCFVPSANTDPPKCGPAKAGTAPTYVGITLAVPNPSGPGSLTVSDGASLRSATLAADDGATTTPSDRAAPPGGRLHDHRGAGRGADAGAAPRRDLRLLAAATRNGARAKATQVALDRAQQEMEKLHSLTYEELAMRRRRPHSSNPLSPNYRVVNGSNSPCSATRRANTRRWSSTAAASTAASTSSKAGT